MVATNTFYNISSANDATNAIGPTPLNLVNNGSVMSVTMNFDLSGRYDMWVTISNKLGQELYLVEVSVSR